MIIDIMINSLTSILNIGKIGYTFVNTLFIVGPIYIYIFTRRIIQCQYCITACEHNIAK